MDFIMLEDLQDFEHSATIMKTLGDNLVNKGIIVHKSLLGMFYDENDIDEVLCKVIGYDTTALRVEYIQNDEVKIDYLLLSDLTKDAKEGENDE